MLSCAQRAKWKRDLGVLFTYDFVFRKFDEMSSDLVLLDVAKALDSRWIESLLYKLAISPSQFTSRKSYHCASVHGYSNCPYTRTHWLGVAWGVGVA
jgi:hypothetical protein